MLEKPNSEKSYRPFFKEKKLTIYLDQQSKVSYSLFLLHVQVEVYQNILKLR